VTTNWRPAPLPAEYSVSAGFVPLRHATHDAVLHVIPEWLTRHDDAVRLAATKLAKEVFEHRLKRVVTICGSTRFRDEMATVNADLTRAGYLVLAPGVLAHTGDRMTAEQKVQLDHLHLDKIDLSSGIYVVNPGGYIGESTAKEIEYAVEHGKTVTFLVPPLVRPEGVDL